jgi:hypothetical protein
MRLPALDGVIDRRLLVNYRVDPEVAARWVPAPFRPQLVNGFAVAGICLIRLVELRPAGAPRWVGLTSENAAHRIAVEWSTETGIRTGVFIPRRDSNATANVAFGGRIYPGSHERAAFQVHGNHDGGLRVAFRSRDGSANVDVTVSPGFDFTRSRLFPDLASASEFFRNGSVGYSATRTAGRFDGLELDTNAWSVEPVSVSAAQSSVFSDFSTFPAGTAELDNALLMRRVPVVWKPLPTLSPTPSEQLSLPNPTNAARYRSIAFS